MSETIDFYARLIEILEEKNIKIRTTSGIEHGFLTYQTCALPVELPSHYLNFGTKET